MDKLNFRLPDDYTPQKPVIPTPSDSIHGIMYWLCTEDGKEKTYKEATPEETLTWAKANIPEGSKFEVILDSIAIENLSLAVNRAALLSITCEAMIESNTNLFGTTKFWNGIKEWRRLQKVEKEKKERKQSDK